MRYSYTTHEIENHIILRVSTEHPVFYPETSSKLSTKMWVTRYVSTEKHCWVLLDVTGSLVDFTGSYWLSQKSSIHALILDAHGTVDIRKSNALGTTRVGQSYYAIFFHYPANDTQVVSTASFTQ